MRKTIPLLFIASLALIVSGCVSNRLDASLTAPESGTEPVIVAPVPSGRNLQPQLGAANIDLSEVTTLLPPDAIPAILPDQVPGIMVTADQADENGMRPNVRVLGVEINGESRAYPVPYMSAHEIVNDEVGGELIAVTW